MGTGSQPLADVAVNHLDGTKLIAAGRNGAISVIAIAVGRCRWTQGGPKVDPGLTPG
jgi:fructose-1,6-bisphosphatase/sedoheptulose 1,7-bisphosphatase-like protein